MCDVRNSPRDLLVYRRFNYCRTATEKKKRNENREVFFLSQRRVRISVFESRYRCILMTDKTTGFDKLG